jgi:hypothetical protein
MKKGFILCCALAACSCIQAQEKKKDIGTLTGGFETYNQLYKKDSATAAIVPQDKFASNNYLKLDYQYKNFTAGVQFESYLPLLVGYPGANSLKGSKLINRYFSYRNKNFAVTVGDFYEQFGSGLVFRAFENRQIGINNALEGANVQFQPSPFLNMKVVYGRQRKYFEYSEGIIRGGDITMNWNKLNEKTSSGNNNFTTGLSVISRYQPYSGADPKIKPTADAWAARFDFTGSSFFINGEYVSKSSDAHFANSFFTMKGNALLLNTGFTKNNLGANLAFRRLENMDFRTERNATQSELLVNYIPALTKQHDFNLSNIYVYNAQAMGETGFQADVLYHFPKGTGIGGKYGAHLALNVSQYNNLDITDVRADGFSSNFFRFGKDKYYRDINIEFRKKWNAKTTTNFLFQNLFYNKSVIEGGIYDNVKANIAAADIQIKYAPKRSARFELQHLSTSQDKKSWAAVLAELSFAPKWTFFVQDMYNYGNTDKKIHYYTLGTAYTWQTTRVLLSYGRQRAGLVCVGGVCRMVPAATGLNVTMTTNF